MRKTSTAVALDQAGVIVKETAIAYIQQLRHAPQFVLHTAAAVPVMLQPRLRIGIGIVPGEPVLGAGDRRRGLSGVTG